jgi:putative ABC transport system ATP-binding protein
MAIVTGSTCQNNVIKRPIAGVSQRHTKEIPMIRLDNIRKTYATRDMETVALNDVSLTIEKGEFVAVMGPSGCGKSTLMNVLGMIDTPTDGSYFFDDLDIAKYRESQLVKMRKNNLGFVFQSFNLIDDLTVEDNIALLLRYLKIPRATRQSRVREALELVGLENRARHKPSQLSGGQQQRVAVARAVIADPKLILADEPTGNLDSQNGEDVMELLGLLNEQGATILMVTHSETDAAKADRIIRMLDGRVLDHGLKSGKEEVA